MLVKTLDDNNIKLTKDVKSAGIAKRALKIHKKIYNKYI
jgi:hypothetical protein